MSSVSAPATKPTGSRTRIAGRRTRLARIWLPTARVTVRPIPKRIAFSDTAGSSCVESGRGRLLDRDQLADTHVDSRHQQPRCRDDGLDERGVEPLLGDEDTSGAPAHV